MPNWCNNHVEISHEDPAMISRVIKSFVTGNLLEEFVPVPFDKDSEEVYNFRVNEWGVKWDVGGNDATVDQVDPDFAVLNFDSAWVPPLAAFEKMLNMGFGIVAYYYEPGMQFAGIWDNGGNEFYKGWGNAAGAEETLPLELDELFNISRDQERWEEDEEDQ